MDRYVEAWSQPGAATAMLNYYRFSVRTVAEAGRGGHSPDPGTHPGDLGAARPLPRPELAEPDHDDVPNLDRVEHLPDASHWVHHDEAKRVNELLVDFFAPARNQDEAA